MSARSRAFLWWGPRVDPSPYCDAPPDPFEAITERRLLTREAIGALYVSAVQYRTPHGVLAVWRPIGSIWDLGEIEKALEKASGHTLRSVCATSEP